MSAYERLLREIEGEEPTPYDELVAEIEAGQVAPDPEPFAGIRGRMRSVLEKVPGYERAAEITGMVGDKAAGFVRGVGEFEKQRLASAARAYTAIPRGLINMYGGEGSAPDRALAGVQDRISEAAGQPEGLPGVAGTFAGTMAPYVAGGAGATRLAPAVMADMAVDVPIAASERDYSLAGMVADYADPESTTGRVAERIAESPALRGLTEGAAGAALNVAVIEGLPRAYRGLRDMGEAGAVVNPGAGRGAVAADEAAEGIATEAEQFVERGIDRRVQQVAREGPERRAGERRAPGERVGGEIEEARRMIESEAGAAHPSLVAPLGGATSGAAVGAAVDDEDRARGAVVGGLVGLGAGIAGQRVLRGVSKNTGPTAATDDAVQRALSVAESTGDIDPDEFVNVSKFALDPTGETRLREEVTNVVEQHGLSPKEKVSWSTTRRIATSLGLDPSELRTRLEKTSGRLSGAEMLAVRNVVSQNVKASDHIAKQIALGVDEVGEPLTTEALERLSRVLDSMESQNDVLLSRFIRERSQAGRDLNNLKILANASMDPVTWMTRAQRLLGAPLPDAVKADIKALVGAGDKEGLIKYVADLQQSSIPLKATTLWKAGLLSAPPTHMVNMISTGAMVTMEGVKDVPAAFYDVLLSTITKTRTKSVHLGDQGKAAVRGARRGVREARAALGGMPTQETLRRWDIPRQVNYKSPMLDLYTKAVYRSLGAEDRLFKGVVLERSIAEQARVLARREGVTGQALKTRVSELIAEPTEEMTLRAIEAAELATFTNKGALGGMASSLKNTARRAHPMLGAATEVAAPFSMTPSNVATRVAEYSPLGALSTIPDVLKLFRQASEGAVVPEVQRKVVERLGRSSVGTLPILAGYVLYNNGVMSLGYPETSGERGRWEVTGQQENSVKIGDQWYSLERVSPLGNMLVLGGHMAAAAADPEATPLSKAVSPVMSIGKTVSEQSFMEGTRRFLEAFEGTDEAQRYGESLVSGLVPNLVRRFARYSDPVQRRRDGVVDAVKASLPGLSETLPARVDPLGEEMRYNEGAVDALLDPFYKRPDRIGNDQVRQEIQRLGVNISGRRKIPGESPSDTEWRLRLEGSAVGDALWERMNQPDYLYAEQAAEAYLTSTGTDLPAREVADEAKREMLEDEIRRVRASLTRDYREFLQGRPAKTVRR